MRNVLVQYTRVQPWMPRGEWIVDAHREGKRFVVRADEKLAAFVELEAAIRKKNSARKSNVNPLYVKAWEII